MIITYTHKNTHFEEHFYETIPCRDSNAGIKYNEKIFQTTGLSSKNFNIKQFLLRKTYLSIYMYIKYQCMEKPQDRYILIFFVEHKSVQHVLYSEPLNKIYVYYQ